MKLSNPRAVASLLALPFYSWVKAIAHARFHFDFLAATDVFVPTALAAFGLIPNKDEVV